MSKSLIEQTQKPPDGGAVSIEHDDDEPDTDTVYYLGVDGGGTKTHAVITNSDCRVLGEGFNGPSNPLRVGLQSAVSNIEAAAHEACAKAGITLDKVAAGCVALAGVNHQIHYHTMKDSLDQTLGIRKLRLVTDARAALEGALDGQPGVVIIAGTGSIAFGRNKDGKEARSGGWGPAFSDEGSGYDIARNALKAVVASFDGRSPQTMLTERLCRKLGIATTADLPGVIYNSDSEPLEIAALAEVVSEAARDGDVIATSILVEAGEELGGLAASVIERLGMRADSFRVACVGSVFESIEYILEPLTTAVQKVAPGASIGRPLFSPAVGAVKLAQGMDVRC